MELTTSPTLKSRWAELREVNAQGRIEIVEAGFENADHAETGRLRHASARTGSARFLAG